LRASGDIFGPYPGARVLESLSGEEGEFAQGELFSKPLRAEEAERFMIAGMLANAAGMR
jgi:hypothetical protein